MQNARNATVQGNNPPPPAHIENPPPPDHIGSNAAPGGAGDDHWPWQLSVGN